MNRFRPPIIEWLVENEDILYNLASSSISDYELSCDCSIGQDHIRLTFGEEPEIIQEGLKVLSKVIDRWT